MMNKNNFIKIVCIFADSNDTIDNCKIDLIERRKRNQFWIKVLGRNFKINVKRFPCIRVLISKLKVGRSGIKINAPVPLYTQANKKRKQSKSMSKQYIKNIKNLYSNICKNREVNRSSKDIHW